MRKRRCRSSCSIKEGGWDATAVFHTERSCRCSKMNWLGAVLAVCVLVPSARCATSTIDWCYHKPSCNDTTWPTIVGQYCNGSRQSPINIVSASAQIDTNLTAFTMVNYDTHSLNTITNTGKTVKVSLNSGVSIKGGGLSEKYDSLQFHLHWGNGSSVPGSEHTVNGKRYPMELHIVHVKSIYGGNTGQAVGDSTGLAALGFLIEEMPGNATGQPAAWNILSSYLSKIRNSGSSVPVTANISMNDLIPGVNTTKYYRYRGSLTTPSCNEAVVWTVFKDTVKVSKDVIDKFSQIVYVTNSTSPLIVNNYRNIQPALSVTTSSTAKTCYSLGLMALTILLGRF
ncbi:carbonic anhydrase 4-like [Pseudoliparis swirei]|uniref:carbonic anhydrase 4-like n=1 Tax=Pseudoliparis swirei TaxID=2059687 RepID=UPI0024BEF5E2|nr:carbonic anhydrase 4-like [Pseudoliparis swirei]